MSIALWCDPGGHAFSERDPGHYDPNVTATLEAGLGVGRVTSDPGQ